MGNELAKGRIKEKDSSAVVSRRMTIQIIRIRIKKIISKAAHNFRSMALKANIGKLFNVTN